MKKARPRIGLGLVLTLFFAIVLPSLLLALFGLRAVKNERYVLEHKLLVDYRRSLSALSRQVDLMLDSLEADLDSAAPPWQTVRQPHAAAAACFVLDPQGRAVYPARFPSRRDVPVAFIKDYSPDFLRRYAEGGPRRGDLAGFARFAARLKGEEYQLAMASLAQRAADVRDFRTAQTVVRRLMSDTVNAPAPLSLSRALLGYCLTAENRLKRGDTQGYLAALASCHEYLTSDSANVFMEEFRFHTQRIENEFARYHEPFSPSLQAARARRLAMNRYIGLLEGYAGKQVLPDSGYFYRDSAVFCARRLGSGSMAVAVLENDVIAGAVRDWAERRRNLAYSAGFVDGWVLAASATDTPNPRSRMAVTESLCGRLPFIQITVSDKKPGELHGMIRQHRYLYLLLLGLLLLAIAVGAGMTYRSVRRELAVVKMRSNFISGVSHELKTPLTSIHMFGEMLQSGKVADEDKKKEYYRIITKESERLTSIINKILDFSRVEDGAIRYEMEAHNVETLIDDALSAMAPVLDDLDVTVNRTRRRPGLLVRCDRKMMTQVFVNLIDNAVKYSPRERAIDIDTAEAGPVVRITVRDRGIGLDEADAEKIFDEFYRANREEVRNIKGTGLGLAIVRKIVKEHRGRVYAEPADPGLRMIVELPVGEAESRKDRTTKIIRLDSPSSARQAKITGE